MHWLKEKVKKNCNREALIYIVFGFATMFVGIFIYQVLLHFNVDYKIANIISLALGKLFAYVTNKLIVFRSKQDNFSALCKEFVNFAFSRFFTGVLDYFILIFAVEVLGFNKVISKYVLQIIVIILNYIFAKSIIFKRKHENIGKI